MTHSYMRHPRALYKFDHESNIYMGWLWLVGSLKL